MREDFMVATLNDLRLRTGLHFSTAFDFHHHGHSGDDKMDDASRIKSEFSRNLETEFLCDFRCKFCHTIHHAVNANGGPPVQTGKIAIVNYKLGKIYEHGCGGPGRFLHSVGDEECPFGFHNGPMLLLFLDSLLENFDRHVVTRLFNNDHNNRFNNRHGNPADATNVAE